MQAGWIVWARALYSKRLVRFSLLGLWVMVLGVGSLWGRAAPTAAQSEGELGALRQAQWQQRELATPLPGAPEPQAGLLAAQVAPSALDDWSKIAFQSYRDGNWEIYSARGDGMAAQRLTAHPAADVRPDFNIGTNRLLFTSNRDGDSEIYLANGDGSGLQQLTFNESDDDDARWSPDGNRFVYVSEQHGQPDLYLMWPAGGGSMRLTFDADLDMMPTWSPDGSQIAWVRVVDSTWGQLMLINQDGSGMRSLGLPVRYMQNPIWNFEQNTPLSPIESAIYVDGDNDGDYWNELLRIRTDALPSNAWMTVVDAGPFNDIVAGSASPDGKWIGYTRLSYVVQNNQLYLVGTTMRRRETWISAGDVALANSGLDIGRSWRSSDPWAPLTSMAPLPALSRIPLTVRYTATDAGASGLALPQFQVQQDGGAWQSAWNASIQQGTATFYSLDPGHTVALRVRGRDNAGNEEPWPAQAQATTTLYRNLLDVQVQDARGVLIPSSTLALSPAPVVQQMNGSRHMVYLKELDEHVVTISHSGYGQLPAIIVPPSEDLSQVTYLPPVSNLLLNPSVEAATLAPWSVSGQGYVGLDDLAHSGYNSVRLVADSFATTQPDAPTTQAPTEIRLEQGVTVPANAVNPTFTMAYRMSGGAGQSGTLSMLVNGSPVATASPDSNSGQWHLLWADLTSWRGQSVSVGVRLQSASHVEALVDSLSLGSWQTPAVWAVEPSAIPEGWGGQVVTLHGDNFQSRPTVIIGGVTMTAVQRLDDQRLRVTLPATMPPGLHTVYVQDSAGRESMMPSALWLGQPLFLPTVGR